MSDSESEYLVQSRPQHIYQYLATFAASLGALTLGCSLGYSSPAGAQLTSNSTNSSDLHITPTQNAYFSSSLTLGLIVGALAGGQFVNVFGHKKSIIFINIPYSVGWVIISAAYSFATLVVGRCLQGFCGGVLSSIIPMYVSEIASKDIRGKLGGAFQLMVVIGILVSYILGSVLSWRWLCFPCGIISIVQMICMFLCKDSPKYLMIKNKPEESQASLKLFRGNHYNIQEEFEAIRREAVQHKTNRKGFFCMIRSWERKPFFICVVLFLFQQTSGVTAVLFNLENIFRSAGSGDLVSLSGIIVGAVQVGATALGITMIDKLGRKILLYLSIVIMIISETVIGVFFYLQNNDHEKVANITWLPLVCLMIYIAAFSLGMGPIPWVLLGEFMPGSVKETAGSFGAASNWLFAFIITVTFEYLRNAIYDYGLYWFYASSLILALIFSIFIPEVKGKSLIEIENLFHRAYDGPPLEEDEPQERVSGHYDAI